MQRDLLAIERVCGAGISGRNVVPWRLPTKSIGLCSSRLLGGEIYKVGSDA